MWHHNAKASHLALVTLRHKNQNTLPPPSRDIIFEWPLSFQLASLSKICITQKEDNLSLSEYRTKQCPSQPAFPRDSSIWNHDNWVRIGFTFPRDRLNLKLMRGSCTEGICLAGVQESIRRAEVRQSLFFEIRTSCFVFFKSGPIWNRSTRFQE